MPDLGTSATQGWSDQELFWIVKNGIRLTGMPAFGPAYSADQIWDLIFYIREIGRGARSHEADTYGRCHREAPVIYRSDGELVEGVIDLAFEETEAWTVVDFKTDPARENSRYRRQLSLYSRAIQAATGSPARGVLTLV